MSSPFLMAPSPAAFIFTPSAVSQAFPGVAAAASPPVRLAGLSPAATGPSAAARPSALPSSSFLSAPNPQPVPPMATGGAARAPSTVSARTNAGLHVEDPSVEARRAVGVLLGAGAGGEGSEGLLERVERDVEELLSRLERAFEEGEKAVNPSSSPSSLTAIVALLARSSVGGFVPPSTLPPPSAESGLPVPTLSQQHLDAADQRVVLSPPIPRLDPYEVPSLFDRKLMRDVLSPCTVNLVGNELRTLRPPFWKSYLDSVWPPSILPIKERHERMLAVHDVRIEWFEQYKKQHTDIPADEYLRLSSLVEPSDTLPVSRTS
ncbi:hypothetical protein JCM8547_008174 [Rhodosporidiobolus lusitaniae]